jgi:hypothetical protein
VKIRHAASNLDKQLHSVVVVVVVAACGVW